MRTVWLLLLIAFALRPLDDTPLLSAQVRITLDETLENHENKRDLIAGERVTLAEEIEVIRLMQAKLEAFVNAMEDECKV